MNSNGKNILIIGGGFAGLAAGMELLNKQVKFTLVEKSGEVGGLSRTVHVGGVDFELGPHIYFNRDKDVTQFWKEVTGAKMKTYQRNNRLYYSGKFIKSPLSLVDTFMKLGPLKISKMLWSFMVAKFNKKEVTSAKDWVISNFGEELYLNFFKVYNEKIWGYDTADISPNWAGQRIKSSLVTMISKSLKRDKDFIIKTFDFPDGGSKTVYERQFELVKTSPNGEVRMNTYPTRISRSGEGWNIWFNDTQEPQYFTDIIATIHLSDLVNIMDDTALPNKAEVKQHVDELKYRNALVVNMVFNRADVRTFDEHWIDIHDPSIDTLRVTNFSNYIAHKEDRVAIGLEFNCFDTDTIWTAPDAGIIDTCVNDLQKMGLTGKVAPIAYDVMRLSKAYPVYLKGYEAHTKPVFDALMNTKGLHLAGRNSLFKWNNMHHSVKTGMLAARNAMGEHNDVMQVKGMVSIGKDSD